MAMGVQVLPRSAAIDDVGYIFQSNGPGVEGKRASGLADMQHLWVGPAVVLSRLFKSLVSGGSNGLLRKPA